MIAVLGTLFRWLGGGALDRLLTSVEKRVDSESERERIKADLVASYMQAQVQVLAGRGWWFPLLFLGPAGFWFASVCIYSVLWCERCAFPQVWTIAALPPPLDEWMGVLIGSLFVGAGLKTVVSALKR
ncbi:hypothetical protein [Terrihabitans rhizophilus]|uniref:Holin of 3TMs, for gene-transfer release n=1 Tax=Terrihabitans rhizophilus TaxID=3092662 RepID=A0ABU4RPQ6_9HYPH|nr:hypothetical protein [Terrihabitans sp. PJ23]MDX6806591.1 hypothetical protein [Terrihabitans sp. PJ23]